MADWPKPGKGFLEKIGRGLKGPAKTAGRYAITPPWQRGDKPSSNKSGSKGEAKVTNWAAIQAFLRDKGYNVPKTGGRNEQTLAAMADWQSGVKRRNPSQWNISKVRGRAITADRKVGIPTPTLDRVFRTDSSGQGPKAPPGAGKPVPKPNTKKRPTDGKPQAETALAASLSSLLRGLQAGGTGSPLAETMARSGARPFDEGLADELAGLQFDAPIRDVGIERARLPRQQAQNEADIGNWFGQVLGSAATAAQRDKQISDAGVGSIRDATKSIVSSLGGEANEGAGVVGAAGAGAAGTLAALGTVQQQYNEDLRPLLEAEKAGGLSRERALGTQRAQDLASELINLQGQRGQARSSALMDIRTANNEIRERQIERLMQIRAANNQMSQQQFQNQLALSEADMAASALGLDIFKAQADAAGKTRKPAKGTFADTTGNIKNTAFNAAVEAVWDPGNNRLRVPTPKAVQLVNSIIASYGWSRKNPNVLAFRNNILQSVGIRPDRRWR